MLIFNIIIILGLWIIYNFVTTLFKSLPYINLYVGNNSVIEMLNIIAIRWSVPCGVLLLLIGILGIIFRKSESNNFSGIKYIALFFGILFSIALML